MKKLMSYLMLSCKRASGLIDKKSIFGLTRREKVMLKMHTVLCDACNIYEKQSNVLDKALSIHFKKENESVIKVIENKELKEKVISRLKND